MTPAFSFTVEPCVGEGANTRRFRWILREVKGQEIVGAVSYATRREAMKEGENATRRATDRGSINKV